MTAIRVNDAQIEIHVGRLPHVVPKRPEDRVNIADVGIGVSQVLPVIAALLVARPGQLVYIEQPEVHLHPRAQVALARLLANAANRGVHVVAETYSSLLLLLGVQSFVAEGVLPPEKVKLHWFERKKKDGATEIRSADLDRSGVLWQLADGLPRRIDGRLAPLHGSRLRTIEERVVMAKSRPHRLVIDACVIGRANEHTDSPSLDLADPYRLSYGSRATPS